MKIAVVGLGAVGGFIAARLAQSGAGFEVSALARGPTLAAVQARGLTLREAVVILEPDALSLATQCNNVEERVHEVHTAVDLLAPTP